jgi:hypothetical protein
MAICLKYLKPAEVQEQRFLIIPRHPFFVRVSLLSVDTEACLCQNFSSVCGHRGASEFLFCLWTQKLVFFRVSLLSVDTEVCLCQNFSSVCGHRIVSLSEFLFCLWKQNCVFVRISLLYVDTEVHTAYEIFSSLPNMVIMLLKIKWLSEVYKYSYACQ